MDICYITCCENGFYSLKKMHEQGIEVAFVVTISMETALKNTVSGYIDVVPWCRDNNIPIIVLEKYTFDMQDLIGFSFDTVIVNGWNRLVSQDVIDAASNGGLGIHAGHPPIGLGRSPLVWNILNNRNDLEVYVFQLTAQADDGAIMAKRPVEITPHDDVYTLYQKVMFTGTELFIQALDKLKKQIPGIPQDQSELIYYPKRTPEDGLIDFTLPEDQVLNFIRAQAKPYPGAFTYLDEQKTHIWKAIKFDTFAFRDRKRIPGQILAALPSGLIVQTGGAPIWILDLEIAGHPIIPGPLEEIEQYVDKRFQSLTNQTSDL